MLSESDYLVGLGSRAATARAQAERARLEKSERAKAAWRQVEEHGALLAQVLRFLEPVDRPEWISKNSISLRSSDGLESVTIVFGKNEAVVTLRTRTGDAPLGYVGSWVRRFNPRLRHALVEELEGTLRKRADSR